MCIRDSCYGSQLMMHMLGGKVCKAPEREYGKTLVDLDTASPLFDTLPAQNVCWMSHNDYIEQAAPGFEIVAHTPNCPVAAAQDKARGLYALSLIHIYSERQLGWNHQPPQVKCSHGWVLLSVRCWAGGPNRAAPYRAPQGTHSSC